MAAQGIVPAARSARFQQSLDIIAGRAQVYFQEPTGYFFPELPQVQFYDREAFDWVPAIEAATAAVRDEILAYIAAKGAGFRPYVKSEPGGVPRSNPLLDNSDWSALFLVENGAVDEEVVERFPNTWAALQAAPLPDVDGMGPTAMFSLLRRGTDQPPYRHVQHPADLPPAADRAARLRLPGGQRGARNGRRASSSSSTTRSSMKPGTAAARTGPC